MLRIPRNPLSLLMNPRRLLMGLAQQTAGVVILAATTKYVPYVWARWGIYVISASMGAWFPLTKAILAVTHLDEQIEDL